MRKYFVSNLINQPVTDRTGYNSDITRQGVDVSEDHLVAGGLSDQGYTKSPELYDPSKGTWKMTGNMSVPRSNHRMSVLESGKVLVTGGYYFSDYRNLDDFFCVKSAEVYDPKTGTWETTSPMNFKRSKHTASVLRNGIVLVTGGSEDSVVNDIFCITELYDPSIAN